VAAPDRLAKMNPQQAGQDRNAEIARLFAELGEVYGRAREGVSAPATSTVTLHVREEAAKASAIIKRIRELQGL
jgi:hypothetical protein